MIAIDQQAIDPQWSASEREWHEMCWVLSHGHGITGLQAMAANVWPLTSIVTTLTLPKLHLAIVHTGPQRVITDWHCLDVTLSKIHLANIIQCCRSHKTQFSGLQVFCSIGYKSLPLDGGVPFSSSRGVIPNRNGRVVHPGLLVPFHFTQNWPNLPGL